MLYDPAQSSLIQTIESKFNQFWSVMLVKLFSNYRDELKPDVLELLSILDMKRLVDWSHTPELQLNWFMSSLGKKSDKKMLFF